MLTLIENALVWDSERTERQAADVLVDGQRIAQVNGRRGALRDQAKAIDRIVDGTGCTLMPGMVEGHCHLSFTALASNADVGNIPPEDHTLASAANATLLLRHGFTSAFSAASARMRIDVALRNAIDSGQLAGPRLRAASPELTVTGGLGDEGQMHQDRTGFGLVVDGPMAMRQAVRTCVREGVDNLKINISGDQFVPHALAEQTPLCVDELDAFMEIARKYGKTTVAHARSSESVKLAVRAGIDCIYHCDYADGEALDLLEAHKDKLFVGPAFGLLHNAFIEHEKFGLPRETVERMKLAHKFESCVSTYQQLRRRGVRIVVGGDYGFTITPMGTNARDIAHFVNYLGFTPAEALRSATTVGADLMGLGDELGLVREGYLADLLLVKGDPLADVSLLQHQGNLGMVMKGGVIYS
ncbi:amidohydrolase family protein [Variovorax sp. J22R133]|uniref:metal-dependent hydrolase family protein n=1 Tax=Variovorax brevis TaxID=3053503 RepID=UPI002576E83C|nr:amidohydrolase family protein [Variovorax sp. J22R133]MDM0115738.1 amidohydrolase family protein [Variovorax sp. J22R133]